MPQGDTSVQPGKMTYTKPDPGEEIVISGASGRFPDCRTIMELREKLMNKQDLITDDKRWNLESAAIPCRVGKASDLSKFDALFFGVHFKQAHTMDPMSRMLLEHAYEAIVDAGINPRQLRGKNIGVVTGACYSESEKTWFYEKIHVDGFGITGCSRAMMSNRISYFLGVHGPSFTVDSACSSSLFALEQAYKMIKSGECEAALVGGANICLHPYVSLQFARLGVLSPDGRSKSFDADANGYARSDTISVIFLQKAKDAKRIYATLVHSKTNCDGYKDQGITFPSSDLQKRLMQSFYEECNIPPTVLSFMEAHGTGTKVGDPEEINAIDEVFCKGRTEPLRIGSVKSNLGHSEPASGLCSIAKVLIAMESGFIPPNINYNKPRDSLRAIVEGRLEVVTEPTPWNGGYVGVNSFGFGGANAHILLKSNPKEKVNNGAPDDDLPRLVTVSGRTAEAVTTLLNNVVKVGVDVEYIRLLHDIHAFNTQGHMYRGYTIVGSQVSKTPTREIEEYSETKRPIWFVFSGMGSQWAGMGKALMRFPTFEKAIRKCDVVLKPRGIDIIDIITNDDSTIFDNILMSFVGIAAVQIGLVDLLMSIGIVPDKIIGHSVGELGCAYADGCFTAEQMILSAYARGLASIEAELIPGAMAAIGLGYSQIKDLCPPDIDVACHNSFNSCTISGPAESVREFVKSLQAQNIFAREVACSNIAYHSRYIATAGPKLLAYLKEVIPEPKPRSEKWISSSVPQSEWFKPAAKFSSAEYHTNNLLSPVLFEEASELIPNNAITIEIAPHGLLQAILKRSLHPKVSNIALTLRRHKDNADFLLQALGKLYNLGLQLDLANLYPPVELPVSRGTPMISPYVKWEHSADWYVAMFNHEERLESGERIVDLGTVDLSYQYMSGHVIDGRNLIPATGYIALVWETLSMMKGIFFTSVPVVFENVRFERATTIPKDDTVKLTIMIHKGTGSFEIIEGETSVVTGTVRHLLNPAQDTVPRTMLKEINAEEPLNMNDIYKELKIRGYDYQGLFRSMKSASIDGRKGHISWNKNWVAFMDTMLQLSILCRPSRSLCVPTSIRKLVINTTLHEDLLQAMPDDNKVFPAYMYEQWNMIISGGVEIHGLKAKSILRKKPAGIPVLEEYKFVAHRDKANVSLEDMVVLSSHLALETQMMVNVKTIELVEDEDKVTFEELVSPLLVRILGDLPMVQTHANLAATAGRFQKETLPPEVTIADPKKITPDGSMYIAIGYNLLTKQKEESLKRLIASLKVGGFLLTQESSINDHTYSYVSQFKLDIVLEKVVDDRKFLLLKKRCKLPNKTEFLFINNNDFAWLEKLKEVLKMEAERQNNETLRLILVAQGDEECGILGLVNCLRKEPGGEIIRAVLVQDRNAPAFSLQNPLYAQQLQVDLPINVLQGNAWGSYRHLPLAARKPKLVRHAYVDQMVRGDLSSLRWVEGPIDPTYKMQDTVHIVYGSVNFRDVMMTTGRIAEEATTRSSDRTTTWIGIEYAGITSTGRRVMGLLHDKSFSNLCIPLKNLMWEVPEDWSLEDAATVPSAYSTCCYALYLAGNMRKGDKVLIHAGSGGVGQAAIHLALAEGCEVFTTVGTPEKRRFIKEMFPSIDDNHIGNSRHTSFEQLIMDQTGGRGVDIVLNSLAEDKLLASVRCLARGGRFLEIGKYDIFSNNPLGMEVFMKEISFKGIMLDNVMVGNARTQEHLAKLLTDAIKKGVVKPITRKVFPKDEIENAFRYMAAGKHIGKVLIKIQEEENNLNNPILAYPSFHCSPSRNYIIVGGLGGLGLELADFLYKRGVDHLVLVSRNGVKTGYQKMRIEFWQTNGVKVQIITGKDASNREDCEFILKTAEKLAPVEGIFNLAVQLKDALCINQSAEDFEESMRPKARITKRLDELSRKICPHLRHFVVFSSVSCGRGTPGQSNYGFANSVMERICERRVAEGLPGLAIEWGAVGEVGLVANMQQDNKEISIGGTLQQRVSSCMEELERFLLQGQPVVSSMVVAEKSRTGSGAQNALEAVSNIMGVKDLKCVSKDTPLAELGMDSMLALEIKQTLERDFDMYLTASEIRNLNFGRLIEMSAEKDEIEGESCRNRNEHEDGISGMKTLLRTMGPGETSAQVSVEFPVRSEDENTQIFLIPGVEGSAHIFNTVATSLKYPTTCLQLSYEYDHRDIEAIAEHLIPFILEKSKNRSNITIVGYSFGSLAAIEVVRKLEAHDFNLRLILIDGTPDIIKAIVMQQLKPNKKEDMEDPILLSILEILSPSLIPKVAKELPECTTWEEKLDVFTTNTTAANVSASVAYQKAICTAIYRRVAAVLLYDGTSLPPLKTPITLLSPTVPSARVPDADYGLHKVTRGKTTIVQVEGNHLSILDRKKVAAVINNEPIEDENEFKKLVMLNPNRTSTQADIARVRA